MNQYEFFIWVSFDRAFGGGKEANNKSSGGLFFVGSFLVILILILTYALLLKLGIQSSQVLDLFKVLSIPFLWDYYIDFSLFDLNHINHVIAGVVTLAILFASWNISKFLFWISDILKSVDNCVCNAIGIMLNSATTFISYYELLVIVLTTFKLLLHTFMAVFIWLF